MAGQKSHRRTFQGVGAAAVVTVLAGASWWALHRTDAPAPEAVTPSPSVTSVTPSATPTAVVTEDVLGLPPTRALPPGLLERTTAGWVLALYRSEPRAEVPEGDVIPALVAHTVVLAAPTGELYRVVDLPTDTGLSLLRWEPGATTATVTVYYRGDLGQDAIPRARLDLVTGTLTPEPFGPTESGDGAGWYFNGVAADGAEIWTTPTSTDAATSDVYAVADAAPPRLVGGIGYTMLLDPTSRRAVTPADGSGASTSFALLDLVDGGATELELGLPGRSCDVVGWLDLDALLALCRAIDQDPADDWAAADPTTYRVDLGPTGATSTLLTHLAPPGPLPSTWRGTWLRSGEVLVDGCTTGAAVWAGGSATPFPAAESTIVRSAAAGDRLYVESVPGCGGGAAPSVLTVRSSASGAPTVLLPQPPATSEVREWVSGLSSWVVAAGR
ncbi:hypothetical protein [Cellulomonas sp.]|uniref:hypothetical protein n=1 Tax=Cellulomonas sp. TaxID=40001 RepID=UPI003BA96BF9